MVTYAVPPLPRLGEPMAAQSAALGQPQCLPLGLDDQPDGLLAVACAKGRVEAVRFPFRSPWERLVLGGGHAWAIRALETEQQVRVLVGEHGWLLATPACPPYLVAALAQLVP